MRRRQSLAWVALLAVAMQAALAFAHTHVHVSTAAASMDLSHRAVTYGMCRTGAEQPCQPNPPHDDHAKCSLCWSINVAGTALLQAPPAIPLRTFDVALPLPARAAAPAPGGSSVHFQARAPPLA